MPGDRLGIHCHDDTGNAVANSLAAVRAGARQVQGTLNGLGERCGNANLVAIIPSLVLKMGYDTGLASEDLARLTEAIVAESRPGDHLVLMSNGSFGGLHERLLESLKARAAA